MKLLGECCVEVTFVGLDRKISTPVQVAEMVTSEVILGRDFLQQNRCAVEMGPTNQLRFTRDKNTVHFGSGSGQEIVMALTIPPQSEMEMMLKVPRTLSSTAKTWLVEPVPDGRSVEVVQALVCTDGDEIPIRLLNTRSDSVRGNQ